jgi:hypothetical protein
MHLEQGVIAAAYLLAAHGVLALLVAEMIGPLGAALVALALAGSLLRARLRDRLGRVPWRGPILMALVVAGAAVDMLWLAVTPLDGIVDALLLLTVARFYALHTARDTRAIAFLSFLMLVAASIAAFGLGFLFVFVGFVVLATGMLVVEQVVSASAPAHLVAGGRPLAGAERGLMGAAALGVVATLLVTAALFFVIPRIGLAALPLRARMGPMVTGFSDRVELGAYGEIETDESVAMRVHLPDESLTPERLANVRWRGIAFDAFDGRAWTVAHAERTVLRRLGMVPDAFRVGVAHGRGRLLTQEIYLEPIGTDIVFAAPTALRVDLRAETLVVDDMGSLSTGSAAARLHYTVHSEVSEDPVPRPAGGAPRLGRRDLARYLQLPVLPARIPALARGVTAGSRDRGEAAARLTDFLAREYRYTLALERGTTLDPVDEFLFVRRSGNCEYFASSLAVMLRSLGIPARVVGGFQRGEWNPYGRYFTVRMRDAHAWVEAHLDGEGWVTLDPSPRADVAVAAPAQRFGLYLDALRMRWYRYVIHWSLRDQLAVAADVRRQADAWRLSVGARAWSWWRGAALTGLVAVALVVAVAARWWSRSATAAGAAVGMPRFYARALRILARRGLRPTPAETAREFAARVARAAPPCAAAVVALTECYEHVRFGGLALDDPKHAIVERALAALAAANLDSHSSRANDSSTRPVGSRIRRT